MTFSDDEYIRNVEVETAIKYIAEQTGNKYVPETKDKWSKVGCNFPFVATDGKRYDGCFWFNRNTDCYFVRIVNGETVRLYNETFGTVIKMIKKIDLSFLDVLFIWNFL